MADIAESACAAVAEIAGEGFFERGLGDARVCFPVAFVSGGLFCGREKVLERKRERRA
jgi:hypothetical protein